MNRKSLLKVLITLVCVLFIFVGCSSAHSLDGKWISLYDDSIYYNFDNKGNYSTNDNRFTDEESRTGTSKIINKKVELYINGNEKYTINLGYIYKNYICTAWTGVLPKTKKDETIISLSLGEQFVYNYTFNNDGTYNYCLIDDGVVAEEYNDKGTYTVNKNVVICTNNDGNEFIFFDTPNGILSAQYKRE